MQIWKDFQSLLNYSFFDVGIGKIILGILAFALIYAFRQIFTSLGLSILRKLTGKTKTTFDDQVLDSIEGPLKFAFIVTGIWVMFSIFELPEAVAPFFDRLIRSLFGFVVFWSAFRGTHIISNFFKKLTAKTKTDIDDQILHFLDKALRIIVVVLGIMVLVREWGYDIAGLVAGLGLGGLAFALAAKDTVANLFGSITLLMDKPFQIGDWIETPDIEGVVEDVRLRSSHVRTFANALVIVPNATLANSVIINWTRMKKRRITFKLGVTYSSTGEQIEQLVDKIKNMLKGHQDIHKDTIFIYFTDFGESALEIFLYYFTITTKWEEFLSVRHDVNLEIMKIVDELGMSIAFPSRSLYIEKANSSSQKDFENVVRNSQNK